MQPTSPSLGPCFGCGCRGSLLEWQRAQLSANTTWPRSRDGAAVAGAVVAGVAGEGGAGGGGGGRGPPPPPPPPPFLGAGGGGGGRGRGGGFWGPPGGVSVDPGSFAPLPP